MSGPRMRLAGGAALSMLLAATLAAQGVTGMISGAVRDSSGTALPRVTVSLTGGGIAGQTRLTDAEGSYRFVAVPPGSYDLSFTLEGFAPEERRSVPVTDGGSVIVTTTLHTPRRYALTAGSETTKVIPGPARAASPGAREDTTIGTEADLTITTADSVDPVIAGTALVYTVTVANGGPSNARDVVVTDTLPAGVSFESTSGCAEDPGGVPSCTLGQIVAGSSKSYTISVMVDADAMGVITNQASVGSSTVESRPGDESTRRTPAIPFASAAPATAGDAMLVSQLADLARSWAEAWSARRIDDYLAFYAAGFRPPGELSRNAWEGLRKNRILEPQRIEVKLSDVEIELLGSRSARVSFDQAYRSDTFDDEVRKTLDLALGGGQWKILEERVEE